MAKRDERINYDTREYKLRYEDRHKYETKELMAEYAWGTRLGSGKVQGKPNTRG